MLQDDVGISVQSIVGMADLWLELAETIESFPRWPSLALKLRFDDLAIGSIEFDEENN